MTRRFGEPVRSDVNYRIRPGVYAVIRQHDSLLLTYQDAPHFEFQLPGGGIDPGEHPLVALHREAFEETGWRIKINQRLGFYRRFVFMPEYGFWAEKVCHIYLAQPVRSHGPPTEAGHTAVWAPIESAASMVASDGDKDFIQRVFCHRR